MKDCKNVDDVIDRLKTAATLLVELTITLVLEQ